MSTEKTIRSLRAEFADLLHPYMGSEDMGEVLDGMEKLLQPHVSPLTADQLRLLVAPFLELRQLPRKPRKAPESTSSDPRVSFRGMLKKLGYDWQQLVHYAGLVDEAVAATELQDINQKLTELLQDQKASEKLAGRYGDMKVSKRLSREIKELNSRKDEIFKLYPELAEKVADGFREDDD